MCLSAGERFSNSPYCLFPFGTGDSETGRAHPFGAHPRFLLDQLDQLYEFRVRCPSAAGAETIGKVPNACSLSPCIAKSNSATDSSGNAFTRPAIQPVGARIDRFYDQIVHAAQNLQAVAHQRAKRRDAANVGARFLDGVQSDTFEAISSATCSGRKSTL